MSLPVFQNLDLIIVAIRSSRTLSLLPPILHSFDRITRTHIHKGNRFSGTQASANLILHPTTSSNSSTFSVTTTSTTVVDTASVIAAAAVAM